MKKFALLLTVFALLLTALPVGMLRVAAADTDAAAIRTAAELKAIAGKTGSFVLAADIDLGGETLTEPLAFAGELDGAGHTIGNFKLSLTKDGKVSLFAQTAALTVKNLKVGTAEAPIQVTRDDSAETGAKAGVLFSENLADAALNVTAVTVYTDMSLNDAYTGAIVARINAAGTVALTDCTVNGTVKSQNGNGYGVGGMIGGVTTAGDAATTVTLTGCVNNAKVSSTAASGNPEKAAGLIGHVNSAKAAVTVTNCVNNGDVEGFYCTGGAIARAESAGSVTVDGFWNAGSFSNNGGQKGGVIGRIDTAVKISNVFNMGNLAGNSWDFLSGIIGRQTNNCNLILSNAVNVGTAPAADIVGYSNGTRTLTNVYYMELTNAKDRNDATKLADVNALLAQLNADGFMVAFRAKFGNFELNASSTWIKTMLGNDTPSKNEVLDPNRTVPANPTLNYKDSPFTKFKPGFVLHHMDFSKVNSFAETGYYITKDATPDVLYVEDGGLHFGSTSSEKKVYMLLSGNAIPTNISDVTVTFTVSFEEIGAKYLCWLSSAMLDSENGTVSKMVDTAIRNTLGMDGISVSERGDDGKVTAEAAARFEKLKAAFLNHEDMTFTFSYKNSKMDCVIISNGEGDNMTMLLHEGTGYHDVRDLASMFGFMACGMTVSIKEITVVAGSMMDWDDGLIWPAAEGDLVRNVSADALQGNEPVSSDEESDSSEEESKPESTPGSEQESKPETNPGTDAETSGADADKKGCASVIGADFAVLAVLALGAVCLKKKHTRKDTESTL